MKLQISEFKSIGGSHWVLLPVAEGMPTELAELGGNKVIDVSEEEGAKLLQAQADAIRFQCTLREYMYPIASPETWPKTV